MTILTRLGEALLFLVSAAVCLAVAMAIVTAMLWLMVVVGYAVLQTLNSLLV